MKRSRTSVREETGRNIKVISRFRPLIDIELQLPENKLNYYSFPDDTSVSVKQGTNDPDTFVYDKVYPPNTSQADIFDFIGKPIIEDVLTGYNGTVFAYGQTGSGKSFTMMGLDIYDKETQGIIPRASSLIFDSLANAKNEAEYTLKCSMLEIYKETLKDLLGNNSSNLKIKEDPRRGIFVHGLTEVYVVCEEEMMDALSLGESNRTVASTKMNAVSSRSHQLFMLEVNQKLPNDSEKKGILNLVDLAGCEKINQTGVTGNKLEEAKKINLSLSALGNVIHALTNKSDHIPYRDSKLTRLLQESLGGNFKTTLIVCCSPHPRNLEDTLNTLKFAQRAKTIKNQVKVNIKRSPEEYMRMINQLKQQLAEAREEIGRMKGHYPDVTSPLMITRSLTCISTAEENTRSDDLFSPILSDDLGISFTGDKLKSFLDDIGPLDQIMEELSSLKQEKESFIDRNKELEKEISNERKKRLKAEASALEYYEMYKKMSLMRTSDEDGVKGLAEENENLKRQIEILEFHLRQMSERFNITLYKLKEGENVDEWEFIEPKLESVLTTDLPVYTEESSLKVYKHSEIGLDIPIDAEFIQIQDEYTQNMCIALEEDSDINKEVLIFQLKKQIIQAGIANSELIRCYYDTQWKYNLLREKFNLKNLSMKHLEKKISIFEHMVDHMHNSYNKLITIIEKLENEHWNKEKAVEHLGRGKIIRPIKPVVKQMTLETPVFVRRANRLKTSNSVIKPQIYDESNRKASFAEHSDDIFKFRSLETNLHLQTLFNQQMKGGYEIVKNECNIFKSLLEAYQKQNLEAYLKEKRRWKNYLEGFKDVSDKELMRKQLEVNKLHEVLGQWIKKFMEIQESLEGPQNEISKNFMKKLGSLLKETRMAMRPVKLNLLNSPLHNRFYKPDIITVMSQNGDCSPPSFED